jgi:hypothetical protein
MIDEPVFVFNLKTNGHPMSVIDDTGNLSSRIAFAVEWNTVEFVAVSVKKVDEVGHDFLSFVFLSLATPILIRHFAVFATAWADFVIELLSNHLFQAALGEGQDFVDFVLHLISFRELFLTCHIDI